MPCHINGIIHFFCVGVLLLETLFSYPAESISTVRIHLYIDLYFLQKSYFFVHFRFICYPLYFILILSSDLDPTGSFTQNIVSWNILDNVAFDQSTIENLWKIEGKVEGKVDFR